MLFEENLKGHLFVRFQREKNSLEGCSYYSISNYVDVLFYSKRRMCMGRQIIYYLLDKEKNMKIAEVITDE